jgi:DNA-binding transcriptional LysR family regulator
MQIVETSIIGLQLVEVRSRNGRGEGIGSLLLSAYRNLMSREPSWDEQRAFLAVFEAGSLSAAARDLALSQPTVRARIENLETALGTVLFTRSAHGLVPTSRARAMADPARAMAHASGALLRAASADADQPAGAVRISVSEVVGVEVLPSLLCRLQERHPTLVFEVELSNATADLLDQQVDVAVRMHRPEQKALIAKKVRSTKLGLYAHRDYLAAYGTPSSREDIEAHRFIGPDRSRADQRVADLIAAGRHLTWSLRTDSHPAQIAAARAGLGIAVVQNGIAAREPQLVRVLPDIALPELETWIVTHENLRQVPRIAAVFEHLVSELR